LLGKRDHPRFRSDEHSRRALAISSIAARAGLLSAAPHEKIFSCEKKNFDGVLKRLFQIPTSHA